MIPAAFPTLVKLGFKGIKEQTRHKLICFEGEAKKSKDRLVIKWWSKYICMTIVETASRSVAFKASRMSEGVLESQDEL